MTLRVAPAGRPLNSTTSSDSGHGSHESPRSHVGSSGCSRLEIAAGLFLPRRGSIIAIEPRGGALCLANVPTIRCEPGTGRASRIASGKTMLLANSAVSCVPSGLTVHSDWIVSAFLSTYSQRPNRIRPSGRTLGSNSLTLLTEIGWMSDPSAFITCRMATPVLSHGTRPLGRVERNTIRPSGR